MSSIPSSAARASEPQSVEPQSVSSRSTAIQAHTFRRRFWLQVGLLAAISVGWAALLGQYGQGNVYAVLGPFSLVLIAIVASKYPRTTIEQIWPSAKTLAIGLAVGVGMTLAVYPAFALATQMFPWLDQDVRSLYQGAQQGQTTASLTWLVLIIAAEEVLWRGRWFRVLRERFSPLLAGAMSIAIYALAQLGSGSAIVALLAIGCGSVWMVLRHYTGTLVAPLLSHLIFTFTVIVYVPVI